MVEGIGLVGLEVPPLATVYQFRVWFVLAVAFKAVATVLLQYEIELVELGEFGRGSIIALISVLAVQSDVAT